MKKLIPLYFALLFSCKEESKDHIKLADSTIIHSGNYVPEENFPSGSMHYNGTWHMLTVSDTGVYIWLPCDAENKKITVQQKENATYINYLIGQSESSYKVEQIIPVNKQYKFITREIRGQDELSQKTYEFNLEIKDRVGYWTIEKEKIPYVLEEGLRDYKTYKQPCKECWGDDETFCDDKKKTN